MAASDKPKLDLLVYLVESPSAVDLYERRSEADLIARAAALNNVPCRVRLAVNSATFTRALGEGFRELLQPGLGKVPVLHISAHGNESGIALASGEILPWPRLAELILPANRLLNGKLLVAMSSCRGSQASSMAVAFFRSEQPFYALIGSSGTPTWSETAVAFASFYHLLCKGAPILDAVAGMRSASGHYDWVAVSAKELRTMAYDLYGDYLQEMYDQQMDGYGSSL